jgi:hypothetical protein
VCGRYCMESAKLACLAVLTLSRILFLTISHVFVLFSVKSAVAHSQVPCENLSCYAAQKERFY